VGIDIHAFNFLKLQSDIRPLGSVLTIGRQSLDVAKDHVKHSLGYPVTSTDGYCEPLLIALGANNVASVDFSDYENATYVADLNVSVELGRNFDTIIDSGSLEHIFDVASAFRNLIKFCKVGGMIIHILPVNNLNGHGFWQFSSDLIFSIYSKENGFRNTKVFYASGIDFSQWYEVTEARPGSRIEVASVEPIILLSVTVKADEVELISVVQPFYKNAWNESDAFKVITAPHPPNAIMKIARKLFMSRGKFINLLRNTWLVFGLATGRSRFSIRQFRRVPSRQ
jgi:hypothetical protein